MLTIIRNRTKKIKIKFLFKEPVIYFVYFVSFDNFYCPNKCLRKLVPIVAKSLLLTFFFSRRSQWLDISSRAHAWLESNSFDVARGLTPLAEAVRLGDKDLCHWLHNDSAVRFPI